jgi:hypothetical protein
MTDKLKSSSKIGGVRQPEIARSQSSLKKHVHLATVKEEGDYEKGEIFRMDNLQQSTRKEAVPSRADAIQLMHTLQEMEASICDSLGGHHPDELAMEAARNADAQLVMEILEPKIYSVDVILNELVKQVGIGCQERGQLLDTCRTHFLAMMSISAAALGSLSTLCGQLQEECTGLQHRIGPLDDEHSRAVQKISSLEIQLTESKDLVAMREAELEAIRQSQQVTQQSQEKSRGKKELLLQEKIDELNDLNSLLKSRLSVLDNQVKQAERNSGVLQSLVQELQERVRRDANSLDFLKAKIASQTICLAWYRCLAHLRRDKTMTKKNAATQDGVGLDHAVNGGCDDEDGDGEAQGGRGRSGRTFGQGGGIVTFAFFWQGVIRQAQLLDLTRMPGVAYRLEKKDLLEKISLVYTEKIMVDELDDKLKLPRQNVPEFVYEYYLELLFDPVLAEEAIVNLVANVRFYESDSPRVRMFGRLLNLYNDNLSQDSVNMFLLSLVKVQSGVSPLLPSHDNLYVDASKALRAIEYVFAQTSYLFRQKLVIECEKRAIGKQIDLDSFLLFLVDMWREEQGRGIISHKLAVQLNMLRIRTKLTLENFCSGDPHDVALCGR